MLSERRTKSADQKTERGKELNPEYNIYRDQPTSRASPLRINTLLYDGFFTQGKLNLQPTGWQATYLQFPQRKYDEVQFTARKNNDTTKQRLPTREDYEPDGP